MGVNYNEIKRFAFTEVNNIIDTHTHKTEDKLGTVKQPTVTKQSIDANARQIDQHLIATQNINRYKGNASNDNTAGNAQEIKQGRDIDPASLISGDESQKPNK